MSLTKYVVRCAIWYHLYNLKNVKITHRGVLILVKLSGGVLRNFAKFIVKHLQLALASGLQLY